MTIGVDYGADIAIDKNDLVTMNQYQPAIYDFYSSQLSKAKADLDNAKDEVTRVEAVRNLYHRRNPPVDLKVTEDVIKVLVNSDSEVLKAREALRVASEKVGVYYTAVSTIEQKKGCIDNLVKMSIANYYQQNPSSDNGGRDRIGK